MTAIAHESGQTGDAAQADLMPVRPATGSTVTLNDATGRFFAVLAQLGCPLALSTDEARLVLVGPESGLASTSALVLPQLRGLAAQGDLIAVGSADGVYVKVLVGNQLRYVTMLGRSDARHAQPRYPQHGAAS